MFEHRIENREQLPHAGDERHFRGFSGGAEPLIEGPEYRIAPHGNHGAHVEGGPDHSPAAPGGAPAPQGSTIAIQGGSADQGSDLVEGQGSRLRQLGNQRAAQDRSHARHTLQQVVPFSPDRGRLNVVSQLLLDRGYLAVQPREVLADRLLDPAGGTGQPILLRNSHLNELPSATDQGTECLSGRIEQVPRGWPDRFGKAGQHLSLNRIGLGEPRPVALATSRTWRGFTTATGSPPTAKAVASGTSRPPVASSTVAAGFSVRICVTRFSMPDSVWGDTWPVPAGCWATSSCPFETSIPTKSGLVSTDTSLVALPCRPILRDAGSLRRPWQLFELPGEGT